MPRHLGNSAYPHVIELIISMSHVFPVFNVKIFFPPFITFSMLLLLFERFWATVCKTVRHILSDRCLSVCPVCLSVCNVGVLRLNGSMHQDETWHADTPRPWLHCVKW